MSLFSEKVDRYPAKLGLLTGTTALAVGLHCLSGNKIIMFRCVLARNKLFYSPFMRGVRGGLVI